MKRVGRRGWPFIFGLGLLSCMHVVPVVGPPVASTVRTGIIECYPSGYATSAGKPVTCETSAVLNIGAEVLVVSDKETPDSLASQAFWIASENFSGDLIRQTALRYDRRPPVLAARKIEDLAVSPDSKLAFATTDFDWPADPKSNKGDAFNTLLYWAVAAPNDVRIVHPTSNQGVVSSISLRRRFEEAMRSPTFPKGPPYFKIEGLAVLPGNRLVFGVREIGTHYETFEYAVSLIEVRYSIKNGELRLDDKFSDAIPLKVTVPDRPNLRLGLSGLLFDAERRRLLMLTSVEGSKDESVNSAYLWALSLQDEEASLASQQLRPQLVVDRAGLPLRFGYKAEGMTLLARDTLLVTHDEDRVQSNVPLSSGPHTRAVHESVFSVLRIH